MDSTSGRLSVTLDHSSAEFETLRDRNIASKGALEIERDQATRAKHVADARKAAMNAKPRSKSEATDDAQHPDQPHMERNRPLQNRPTSRTARAVWNAGLDLPIASEDENQGRWETSLVAGGTHGSIPLSQREQKLKNAAATAHKTAKSYIQKADAMYHPTLEAHRRQDAVDLAIMRSDAEAEAGEAEADAAHYRALSIFNMAETEEQLLEEDA